MRALVPSSRLSLDERRALRRAGLSKSDLAEMPPQLVRSMTGLPVKRCRELSALLQFERCVSVGPSIAGDLWRLGYRSLLELANEVPEKMYSRLCQLDGRVDPCVEDVFHAVVAQARSSSPREQRVWWFWTSRRKQRAKAKTGKRRASSRPTGKKSRSARARAGSP